MGLLGRLFVWLRALLLSVLAQGAIPKHVAFIMDGNRRFAKKKNVAKITGHTLGFKTLEKILEWCMELGVQEVTVYAFSIENFKRPKDEVDGLMELAGEKFQEMMQENKMIDKLGIRVRIAGDLALIPEKVRTIMDKVVDYSQNNTKATLNVCFAYTAREELVDGVRKLANTAKSSREVGNTLRMPNRDEERMMRLLQGNTTQPPLGVDWTWREGDESEEKKEKEWGWEDEMWHALQVKSAPELLVRTSGEVRLSDFLLWQSAFSCVLFLNVLWPDFSLWHFLYVVLMYQYNFPTMQKRRKFYVENMKNHTFSTTKQM